MANTHTDSPDFDLFSYVDHPRYGRNPRITGLSPNPLNPDVQLHWNSQYHLWHDYGGRDKTTRIPNTAIVADTDRQVPATVQITHYFDVARICVDCKRPFIFFAEEQKYWYEELGFTLNSDCIRCFECRKQQQGLVRAREMYEQLFHIENRSIEQNLDMAEACLDLIEAGIFTKRKTETVRMLFNSIECATPPERMNQLQKRLLTIEQSP